MGNGIEAGYKSLYLAKPSGLAAILWASPFYRCTAADNLQRQRYLYPGIASIPCEIEMTLPFN